MIILSEVEGRSRGSKEHNRTPMVGFNTRILRIIFKGHLRLSKVVDEFQRWSNVCGVGRTFEATFDESFGDGRRQRPSPKNLWKNMPF